MGGIRWLPYEQDTTPDEAVIEKAKVALYALQRLMSDYKEELHQFLENHDHCCPPEELPNVGDFKVVEWNIAFWAIGMHDPLPWPINKLDYTKNFIKAKHVKEGLLSEVFGTMFHEYVHQICFIYTPSHIYNREEAPTDALEHFVNQGYFVDALAETKVIKEETLFENPYLEESQITDPRRKRILENLVD